ncbi:amidoligase family protein [Luteococcus sp.]|uniref:amidoligase family protein n=1 Tax=Luteococcus sp. TaxID=1969402 RepID=UPI0037370E0B
MVCREFNIGSVVIAQVRTGSWLTDNQVQSIFHTLGHDPRVQHAPGVPHPHWDRREVFDRIVARAEQDIETNPMWRPARRNGLRERLHSDLERAYTGLTPEQLTALERLAGGVQEAQRQLRSRLQQIAGRRGMSEREVMAEYTRLRAEAPRGRGARATDAERAALGLIPADGATRYALRHLEQAEPRREPQREVNQWMPVTSDPGRDNPVVEVGISDVSNRIEARHADGTTTAWVGTPDSQQRLLNTMGQGHVPASLVREVCHDPAPSTDSGYRIRCDTCGRFVGSRPHQCVNVTRAGLAQTVQSVRGAQITFVDLQQLHAALTSNDDVRMLAVPTSVDLGEVRVDGDVAVRRGLDAVNASRDTTVSNLDIDDAGLSDTLTCNACHSGHCEHADAARELLRQQFRTTGTVPNPLARSRSRNAVLDEIAQVTTAEATAAEQEPARVQVTEATLSMVERPDVFRTMARQGASEGVSFDARDGALTGHAAGVRFGVELEFGGNSTSVTNALADAGIIPSRGMRGYHHAQRSGWVDWSLEIDGSVSGELVSPILSDTEDHWRALERACATIRDNGGTTRNAGSHTNISSDNFRPEHAWRLAHLMRMHEDDLFRMGRTRGSARAMHYTGGMPNPGMSQWSDTTNAYILYGYSMVNLEDAFREPGHARLEYRFPDASHQPGVIQGQVKLCAAMTNWVRHNEVTPGTARPLGTSRSEGWGARAMTGTPDEFADHTAGVRTLIDQLFDNDNDRIQIAQLWGQGSYNR